MPAIRTTRHLPSRRAAFAAAALTAIGLLSACGSGAEEPAATGTSAAPSTSAAPAFPVTVTGANGPVTLDKQPTAIVSLSPTATEMLYAMGAGKQVKAVDDQSSFPAEAPRTKLSGFTPNVEAIAGYQPDLVIFANDANGLAAGLDKLGIPALLLPAATKLDDSYSQLTTLGQATGNTEQAAVVVAETKKRIEAAVASVPKPAQPLKVYHELDPTFYSVTSETFVGSLYELFGLTNIADQAADTAGGYPQLSAEFVVKQAPNLIVLADTKCCKQDAGALAKRPAFGELPAITDQRVLAMDDDIASRWGPRVADFAEQLAAELKQP